MRKIITYISFVIASLLVVLAFVTATTYIQLGVAVILYPLLVYFAFKIFPRKSWQEYPTEQVAAIQPGSMTLPGNEDASVIDIDKRTFLKLIGASGLSLLLYWVFTKKAGAPLFGGTSESGTVSLEDTAGNKIDPAEKQPTDGYKITEIDDSIIAHYGFTHKNGSWFIMRLDTDTGSFRYVRGISDFPGGWTNREQLKYDYYINVF
ncbi:MAG: hypothetical protein NTZ07_03840 [Candidatus Woesebacteria bacterium]|nr:hypothetical protein [Candidatus Woesebacteria bacterium]